MRGELVALDLETTGLDPRQDEIIEVGAVRLRDGAIVDSLTFLVRPNRRIPPFITTITGIDDDMVRDQPPIEQVIPSLKLFVGDAPVIAHNVGFDVSFLRRQGMLQTNPQVDTYDLASILLPRAPRYSLGSLTALLDIPLEAWHRALADAAAAGLLYWRLWEKLLALPIATLYEIVQLSAGLPWDTRIVFTAALQDRLAAGETVPAGGLNLLDLFARDDAEPRPITRAPELTSLDVERVSALVAEDGPLAYALPHYEYRPQQGAMSRAIADSFNRHSHMLIEAGTGTGKSVAYLVPALAWAASNGARVVVSTNTINLQDQLIGKDIPQVGDALGLPVTAAVLKGRGNYLCPRRLLAVRRRRPTSVDELRTVAKVLVWLLESASGDRGELNLRGRDENTTWQRLSAEDEFCTTDRCAAQMGGVCPFYKAHRRAEAAHVVVVNHALLIADALSEHRVIPEYDYLIVDEAHHLEDATTNGLSFHLDEFQLRRRLADLGGARRGLLGSLLQAARARAPEREVTRLERGIEVIADAGGATQAHITHWFAALRALADDVTSGKYHEYVTSIRVVPKVRERESFAALQARWRTLREFFEGLSAALGQLLGALERLRPYDLADFDDLVSGVAAASRYLDDVRARLDSFFEAPDANTIYWLSVAQDAPGATFHTAPLHVGKLVDEALWSARESVVLTSATLQTNGSFDYLRGRLGAEDVETLELGSPYNYRESTLVYVPTDIPDPSEKQKYQQAVERGIVGLAAALDGRVMALFTSYAQLRETSQAISPRLALGNIVVYDQSDGSSRQALLDGFKTAERAVLLGTRSFWEGVDIAGDPLSALVIVRLPFSVPNDPIVAARSETYGDAFTEYSLPDAILRFRQGFGRLIRSHSDRGIVAIFDSRVARKSYGASFLAALPDCVVQQGALEALPEAAARWLDVRKV